MVDERLPVRSVSRGIELNLMELSFRSCTGIELSFSDAIPAWLRSMLLSLMELSLMELSFAPWMLSSRSDAPSIVDGV